MKKIVSLTLVALTLCIQHENHAMYRQAAQNISRIGQQCTQRWAPAYRTLTTGARQQLSNLRPQISQQFRNMQTSARNWGQNLNLPTARTTALGLGAGLTTAAYLQRPNWQRPDIFGVVGAEEEETPSDVLNNIKAELDGMKGYLYTISQLFNKDKSQTEEEKRLEIRAKLRKLIKKNQNQMTATDRKNFALIINDLLNNNENNHPRNILNKYWEHGADEATFVLGNVRLQPDVLFINAAKDWDDIPGATDPNIKIEIPTIYIKLFKEIHDSDNFKKEKEILINMFNHTREKNIELLKWLEESSRNENLKNGVRNRIKFYNQMSEILEEKSTSQ